MYKTLQGQYPVIFLTRRIKEYPGNKNNRPRAGASACGRLFLFPSRTIEYSQTILLIECHECVVGFVDVHLGYDFHWCMHGHNWYTQVNHIDVHTCDELCNSTAATFIDFAQFAGLPVNVVGFHDADDFGHGFCAGVTGATLASCTCVLGQDTAFAKVAGVACFIDIRECRVKGSTDI